MFRTKQTCSSLFISPRESLPSFFLLLPRIHQTRLSHYHEFPTFWPAFHVTRFNGVANYPMPIFQPPLCQSLKYFLPSIFRNLIRNFTLNSVLLITFRKDSGREFLKASIIALVIKTRYPTTGFRGLLNSNPSLFQVKVENYDISSPGTWVKNIVK